MAMTLEQILNFVIPIAVGFFVIFIVLYPFREPLSKLWGWIKNWNDERDSTYEENVIKVINYE
jgi:ATP/ADP translocase